MASGGLSDLGEVRAATASPPSWQLRLGPGWGLFLEPGREAGRALGRGRWPRASPPRWAALLCGPEEALQRPGPFVYGEDGAGVAWLLQAWKESGIERSEPASRMGRRSQCGSLLDLSHCERLSGPTRPGHPTLPSSAGGRACVLCARVCGCFAALDGESFRYKWAFSRDRRARRLCRRPSPLTLQDGLASPSSTCPPSPDPTSNVWGPWR